MATSQKRLTISLPDDIEKGLDELKKSEFYNSPQSKMIQQLIRIGLEEKRKEHAS